VSDYQYGPNSLSDLRSEGALIWFIKQTVMARVARKTFCAKLRTHYVPWDTEHMERQAHVLTDLRQVSIIPPHKLIDGAFLADSKWFRKHSVF
jgi:hypothetical protein